MIFPIESIVYRKLTDNDFDKINSVVSSEYGGGGQGYIDFPVTEVSITDWNAFLGTPAGHATKGPYWLFRVHSARVASDPVPELKIYQRRPASVCVSSQRLHSRRGNRVPGWKPVNGFPNTYSEGITVFFVKNANNGEIWAGWFMLDSALRLSLADTPLSGVLNNDSAGKINFSSGVSFNTETTFGFDFLPYASAMTSEEVEDVDLEEDVSLTFLSDLDGKTPTQKARIQHYKDRNKSVVNNLKDLYNGVCQITGDTFVKKNGGNYSEVHHLIPLGRDGSDSYANAIVVSPTMHRMLHYANVGPIDLRMIRDHKLDIQINGTTYTITYKPEHEAKVREALESREVE